jgi:hypothetical protein
MTGAPSRNAKANNACRLPLSAIVSQFVARPKTPIDASQVEQLAQIGCTSDEIAAILTPEGRATFDPKIIERRFGTTVKKGRQKLNGMLKRELIKQVKAGNTTALIFALKVFAGMKETPDVAINVSATAVGGQVIFSEETKKQLEDFHVQLQRRVYQRTHIPAPSGNGDQTALN